ncbi:MAG: leucine-rich repeat domain-containing protein [Clostridia bacterium]|nr:leucine-rich repeat domain-containing protein [Clostridia bacterium]
MKKYSIIIVIALILAFTVSLSLVACGEKGNSGGGHGGSNPIALGTPTVTVSDTGSATWTAVDHASSYAVIIDNGSANTYVAPTYVQLADGQSIAVKAIGDGTNYSDGAWSNPVRYTAPGQGGPTVLDAPVLTISADGKATWTMVDHAEGYQLVIDGTDVRSFVLPAPVQLADGQTVSVRAMGDGTSYANSGWAPIQTYTAEAPSEPVKLGTPQVVIDEDGEATWAAVANASGYKFKLNGGQEQAANGLSVNLQDGDSIVVKAVGDGTNYSDSDWSAAQTYTAPQVGPSEPVKLATPVVTISEQGVASWAAIANASGYKFKLNGGAEESTNALSVNLQDGDVIRVKAVGDGESYSDSNWSAAQTYTAPVVATQLATPDVYINQNGIAIWEAVSHASGYKFKINGGQETLTYSTSVPLEDGDSFVVKALGDGVDYSDSAWSAAQTYTAPQVGPVRLATPAPAFAEGSFSWSAVVGASSYRVYWYSTSWDQDMADGYREGDLAWCHANVTTPSYTPNPDYATDYWRYQVKAIAGDADHLDSDWSAPIKAAEYVAPPEPGKLATPVLRVEDGHIVWDPVPGAEYYLTRSLADGYESTAYEGGLFMFDSCMVKAVGDGVYYFDSDWTNPADSDFILPAPELSVAKGKIVWPRDSRVTDYDVSFNDEPSYCQVQGTYCYAEVTTGGTLKVRACAPYDNPNLFSSPWASITFELPENDGDLVLLNFGIEFTSPATDVPDFPEINGLDRPLAMDEALIYNGSTDEYFVLKEGDVIPASMCTYYVDQHQPGRTEPGNLGIVYYNAQNCFYFDNPLARYPWSMQHVASKNVSIDVEVRNRQRDSFIDLVLYLSWMDTYVVFNEGNGDYLCATNTIYDRNYEEWVTHITIDVTQLVFSADKYCYLEIMEINFLHSGTERMAADLADEETRTREFAWDGIDQYNLTNSNSIARDGDFIYHFYDAKWVPLMHSEYSVGADGSISALEWVVDGFKLRPAYATVIGYVGDKTRVEEGDIPEIAEYRFFDYTFYYPVRKIDMINTAYDHPIEYLYVPDWVDSVTVTGDDAHVALAPLMNIRLHEGITDLNIGATKLGTRRGDPSAYTTVDEWKAEKWYLGTEDDPYFALIWYWGDAEYDDYALGVDAFDPKPSVIDVYSCHRGSEFEAVLVVDNTYSFTTDYWYPGTVRVQPKYGWQASDDLTAFTIPRAIDVDLSSARFTTNVGDYIPASDYHLYGIQDHFTVREIIGTWRLNNVSALTIGEGVEIIRDAQFNGPLTLLSLPSTVEYIYNASLHNTSSLLEELILPQGLKVFEVASFSVKTLTIPDSVIDMMASLPKTETLILGDGLTSLLYQDVLNVNSSRGFSIQHPYVLKTLVVGDGVTEIPDEMLKECTSLRTVTLGDGVTRIGRKAFQGCTQLQTVGWGGTTEIAQYAFAGCNRLNVPLPEGLLRIGRYAFSGCASLALTDLPQGLERVAAHAFENCTALTDLSLAYVKEIGESAFVGCNKLAAVTLGAGLRAIEASAFQGCVKLTALAIPAGVTVGESAFQGCSVLADVSIGAGATIGESAFSFDTAITTIAFGDGVSVGPWAFYAAGATIPVTSLTMGDGVNFADEYAALRSTVLESVDLSGVTAIGDYAFYGMSALSQVTMGDWLSVGKYAFYGTALSFDAVPDTVTSVGDYAFYGCTFDQLLFGDDLASVGAYAFAEANVSAIRIPDGVQYVGDSAFALSTKTVMPNHAVYNNLGYLSTDSNPYWMLMGLSWGANPSAGYGADGAVIHPDCKYIAPKGLEGAALARNALPQGLLGISAYGLEAVSSVEGADTLVIPDSVLEMGYCSIEHCYIQHVVLGAGLTALPQGAFYVSSGLVTVSGGANVRKLGNAAFAFCSALTTVDVPNAVWVDDYAFGGSPNLTSVQIADEVEYVSLVFGTTWAVTAWHARNFAQHCASLPFVRYETGCYYLGNTANPYAVLLVIDPDETNVILHEGIHHVMSVAFGAVNANVICNNDGYADYLPSNEHEYYVMWRTTKGTGAYKAAGGSGNRIYYVDDLEETLADPDSDLHIQEECVIIPDCALGQLVVNWGNYNLAGTMVITIPDSVIYVGDYAFSSERGHLYKVINVGRGVKHLGGYLSHSNSSLWLYDNGDPTRTYVPQDTVINYNGTMAEWEAIEKEDRWDWYLEISSINCTDGVIDCTAVPDPDDF